MTLTTSPFWVGLILWFLICAKPHLCGQFYDSSAYTECKMKPEAPLYSGGIIRGVPVSAAPSTSDSPANGSSIPAIELHNLTASTIYCFSGWVRIQRGVSSALVRARLAAENTAVSCVGTVVAQRGCWSFLKGGFVLDSPSSHSLLTFQNADGSNASLQVTSASLQSFTDQEWREHQQSNIQTMRKRAVTLHISDGNGGRLQGAEVRVQQVSNDFPFGSAITKTILANKLYQDWFKSRFNAAVFEDELKWYATEPQQGRPNYTVPDQMLEFVRENQVTTRGHNIFWENPNLTPSWVRKLTGEELESAVTARIRSLLSKYKDDFINWDVNNEMLHYDFYEQQLGHNATQRMFDLVHQLDPMATLYMNEFNVIETCDDSKSTVDAYISRIRELGSGGAAIVGVGLQGHFSRPNLPLMRGVLDKLATLGLPIWLTEVDISNKIDLSTQAVYLEQVLREGYSHPAVNGVMLWTAWHATGCYMMCLTDNEFKNLPTGDVVDTVIQEWQTEDISGQADDRGTYSFYGFLGEYKVEVKHGNASGSYTFSLNGGHETRHFSIQLQE
uniref:GH10 domain-containing protein n=1 Tax=Kalanchoe fedtschenkoi TaxID=63787 RepID=A0A7N0UZB2_KALFE